MSDPTRSDGSAQNTNTVNSFINPAYDDGASVNQEVYELNGESTSDAGNPAMSGYDVTSAHERLSTVSDDLTAPEGPGAAFSSEPATMTNSAARVSAEPVARASVMEAAAAASTATTLSVERAALSSTATAAAAAVNEDTDAMLSAMEEEIRNTTTVDQGTTVNDMNDSKDRTQVAATSTLSIVQVALLKDILDGGPEVYRYYEASLAMLSICIILEIVTAFVILALYMLKTKLNKASISKNRSQQGKSALSALDSVDGIVTSMDRNANTDEVVAILNGDVTPELCNFPNMCETSLEKRLSEAYNVVYMDEITNSIKLAKCHAAMRVLHDNNANNALGVPDNASENTMTSCEEDKTRNSAMLACDYTRVLTALRTARTRQKVILDNIFEIQTQRIYKHLLQLQSSLTYIFLVLTFLNIFIVVFAVPKNKPTEASTPVSGTSVS